ncbi:hypothetical protein BDZ97DRAFT_1662030 [Flammula alnicola]|nr:hypothetical protein BDZ97DRAFT_1662030 [Flammula alnicola]
MSLHNVTVDDGNSTLISYQPPLCNGSGWTVNNQRGFSGSFRYCTTNDTLSANLSFTGVAVYYVSPTFEGQFIRFRLDGIFMSDAVNLSTPTGQTINATQTRVMWSQTSLDNKQHLLELHPGNGSTTLNVDAFIITQADATPSSSIIPIPTAATANSGLSAQSSKTTRLAMGFGITFGSLSFLIFLGIAIFLGRRIRRVNKRYSWSKTIPPLPVNEPDTFDTRGYTQDSSHSPVSPQGAEDIVPMHPLPSVAHGSFTTHDFEHDDRASDTTKGWASPVPSHTHLLHNGPPSSQGHGDPIPFISRNKTFAPKLEPMRSSPVLPSPHLHYSAASSSRLTPKESEASVSRSTTFASRLEPAGSLSYTSYGDNGASVSRSTTFTSKLEPVRKGTVPSGS